MQPSSNYHLVAVFVALGIFVGMLTALEIGRRIGIRRQAEHGENARIGIGVVDGAVYAVLSLLIGFTFSGAAGRRSVRQAVDDVVDAELVGFVRRRHGVQARRRPFHVVADVHVVVDHDHQPLRRIVPLVDAVELSREA